MNIVEGQADKSKREFLKFLNIANRSLVEVEYLFELVKELNFVKEAELLKLEKSRSEIAIMLNSFKNAVANKL